MVYENSGLYLVLYFYRMLNVTNNYFFLVEWYIVGFGFEFLPDHE